MDKTTSPSRKSDSATTSQPKHRDRQRDILKRKPRVRQLRDSDWRFMWAGYEMGMWRDNIPMNLPFSAFQEIMLELLGEAVSDWIVESRFQEGIAPIGFFIAQSRGEAIEPYVEWFPWATARNKIECAVAFLKEVSKQQKLIIFSREDYAGFWSRMVQYGVARRGCKVIDYFSRGEHALMFYTVNK